MMTEYLLHKDCSRCFTHINSFSPHQDPALSGTFQFHCTDEETEA